MSFILRKTIVYSYKNIDIEKVIDVYAEPDFYKKVIPSKYGMITTIIIEYIFLESSLIYQSL